MNEEIDKINDSLQNLDTRIVYLEDKQNKMLKNPPTGTTPVDLSAINQQLSEHELQIEDLNNLTANHSTSIDELSDIATQNTNQISTNTANIAQNMGDIQQHSTQIANNVLAIQNNCTNIDSLNLRVITLEQNGGSSGDLTELENLVEENTQNIAVNTQTLNDFLSLIKDRNRAINVPYNELDFSNTYQTYDCFERRYRLIGKTVTSLPIFFRCNIGNLAVKSTVTISASSENVGVNVITLHNGVQVDSHQITIGTEKIDYTFYYNTAVNEISNNIEIKLTAPSNITLFKVKSEFTANNIAVLSKIEPYQVYYYNDYYYISNCTGNTAKYCIINKNDLHTTNDIIWTDTNIEANELHFYAHNADKSTYVIDTVSFCYLGVNNNYFVYDSYFNIETPYSYSEYPVISIGATLPSSPAISVATVSKYTQPAIRYLEMRYSNEVQGRMSMHNISSIYIGNFISIKHAQFGTPTFNSISYYSVVSTQATGELFIYFHNKTLMLPFGTNVSHYFVSADKNSIETYANIFGQVVKYSIRYANASLNLINTEVVGYYDKFFKGCNNDYFYVKNNKLVYVSNELQD